MHENKDEMGGLPWCVVGNCRRAAVGIIFPPATLGAAAAGGVIGGVSGHLARGMSRSDSKEPGDFIDPDQAGLAVGESKVQEAIKKPVTKAEKQTARELGVDPKDVDRALQEAVREI